MFRFVSYDHNTGQNEWLGIKVDSLSTDILSQGHLESGGVVAYCESVEKFAKVMGIEVDDINDCGLGKVPA